MPYLLQDLFKETKNHGIRKKDKKRMSRSCKYIKNYQLLPELPCPEPDGEIHKNDIEDLLKYYHDPVLPEKFLTRSHDSVKRLFKDYCKENELLANWNNLKNYTKDLSTIVAHLKYKHNRPRPKEFLGNDYSEIDDMFNPSFPSGHTASAYFIAEMLSYLFPNHAQDLKKLAECIGQSRIENGVHFPSDILFGRFIGETLARLCTSDANLADLIDFSIKRQDEKNLKNFLLKKSDNIKQTCHDMTQFIYNSNKIEGINLNYEKCFKACSDFLSGYPVEKCTTDNNILSHLTAMVAGNKLNPIENPFKYIVLHKQLNSKALEKGSPGEIRSFKSYAKNNGNEYSKPELILKHLEKIQSQTNPYVKHILFEWIHPFADGNGRIGRIALLADSNFNFKSVNEFCNNAYIKNIVGYINHFKDITNII